jgi:flagellar hook-length control protein FliK
LPRVESQISVQSQHHQPGPRSSAANPEADRSATPFALLVDGGAEAAKERTDRAPPSRPSRNLPTNGPRPERTPRPIARPPAHDHTPPKAAQNADRTEAAPQDPPTPDPEQQSPALTPAQLAEDAKAVERKTVATDISTATPPDAAPIAEPTLADLPIVVTTVIGTQVASVTVDGIAGAGEDDPGGDGRETKDDSGKTAPAEAATAALDTAAVVAAAPIPPALALREATPGAGDTDPAIAATDAATPVTPDGKPAVPGAPKGGAGPKAANGAPGTQQPQAGTAAPVDGNAPVNPEQVAGHAEPASKLAEKAKSVHLPAGAADRLTAEKSDDILGPRNAVHGGELAPNGGHVPGATDVAIAQQGADRTIVASAAASPAAVATPAPAVPVAGIAVEIAGHAQSGRNTFEIRLDPPELGRIDVRLDVDSSGQVTSRLVVDKAETLEALRRDAGDLERALQQAGLKTSDNGLQFALRDQSFAGRDQGSGGAPSPARHIVLDPDLAPLATTSNSYGRTLRAGGGIDIRV